SLGKSTPDQRTGYTRMALEEHQRVCSLASVRSPLNAILLVAALTLIVFTFSFTESIMYTVFDMDVTLFFISAAASTHLPRQIEDALAADGIDPKAVSVVTLNQPIRTGHGIYGL
ncbi:MAG: hypothetical protein AAFR68_19815, partial [Pseudomonadota bacterium]